MRPPVLYLTDICPWPPQYGGAQRASHLISQLAREYELVVLGVDRGSRCSPPESAGVRFIPVHDPAVRGFSIADLWQPVPKRVRALLASPLPFLAFGWSGPTMHSTLRRLATSGQFEAVWACRVWAAEAARRAGFRRIIADVDDLPGQVLERLIRQQGNYQSRWLHTAELWKIRRYERRMSRRFAAVTVCKSSDVALVGGDHGYVSVVPNGVERLPPVSYGREDPSRLLFVGHLAYEPNADAVRFFAREVLPLIRRVRPDAKLTVAGTGAPSGLEHLPGCTLLGFVDDLGALFDASALSVAPLRLGSGTKLIVLESLARGHPTVGTSVALEGIDVRPGVDVMLADDPTRFADACLRLLADPVARERMGRRGRDRVSGMYDWEQVGQSARVVVASVLAHGAA